jgi:hypothetical protein
VDPLKNRSHNHNPIARTDIRTLRKQGFLFPKIHTSAIVALSVANTQFHLAAVLNQSYLYANGN